MLFCYAKFIKLIRFFPDIYVHYYTYRYIEYSNDADQWTLFTFRCDISTPAAFSRCVLLIKY